MARQTISIKIDLKVVCALLVVAIVVMLGLWRPWQSQKSSESRTTTQTGQATIKAEPDQFIFSPYYELANTNAVAEKATSINAKLKELGVADTQIKNNASSYDLYGPEYYSKIKETVTTLSLTITIDGKELAQKVQDYLLTTSPKGAITPYASFSKKKQQSLENEAREKALADARSKADQIASTLKVKIGKVMSVKDGDSFGSLPCSGGVCPMASYATEDKSTSSGSSLTIQSGENEFTYSVTVTFELE